MQIAECNRPVSENIQRIIDKKGLKQAPVAEKAGFTPSAFSAMVRGRKLIKPCDVKRIANALDVPTNELFKEVNE